MPALPLPYSRMSSLFLKNQVRMMDQFHAAQQIPCHSSNAIVKTVVAIPLKPPFVPRRGCYFFSPRSRITIRTGVPSNPKFSRILFSRYRW